jgi:ABC-type multidrug transport system fused ATPase/permease subunit
MSERSNLGTDVSQASLRQVIGEITRDMSRLVRQEMDLAKAELRQQAKTTGRAAGMFGGAGLAGYMVLLFLSLALWWGLSEVIDRGWVAALVVAAVWAIIGAMLFLVARTRMRQMRQAGGMRQTADTVREVPGTLKGSRS